MKNEFKSSRKIFNKIRLPKVKHKKIIWLGLAFLLIFGIFTPITALAADKTSGFTSFDQLMKTVGSFNGTLKEGPPTDAALWYYNHWGQYLKASPVYIALGNGVLGTIAKVLYGFVNGLENIYENLFNLFGLFGYLSDNKQGGIFYTVYHGLQTVGLSLFIMLLVGYIIISLFTSRPKYKDIMVRLITASFIIGALPWGITQFSTAIQKDIGTTIKSKSLGSLAVQPIRNNTVDLKVLAENGFDEKTYPLDSKGYLKNIKKANNITDSKKKVNTSDYVGNVNFSASLGVSDTDVGNSLDKAHKGLKGLFEHEPNSTDDKVIAITEHRFMKSANALENIYPRYRVNWIAVYAQYIVLIVLLLSMSIKIVKSIYEVFFTSVIAPLIAYTEVEGNKKVKELLGAVVGGIAGIFFEVLTLRMTVEILRDLPNLKVFDGLSSWQNWIMAIIIYLGIFFGAMQGITIVERWLGVSTGHNEQMQQMMGAMMLAGVAGGAASGLGHLGAGDASIAASGVSRGTKALPGMARNFANKAAGGIGAAQGVGNKIAQQGLGKTMSSGATNAFNKASKGISNKAEQFKKSGSGIKDSYNQGVKSGSKAVNNNSPSADDVLKGKADPPGPDTSKMSNSPGTSDDAKRQQLEDQATTTYNPDGTKNYQPGANDGANSPANRLNRMNERNDTGGGTSKDDGGNQDDGENGISNQQPPQSSNVDGGINGSQPPQSNGENGTNSSQPPQNNEVNGSQPSQNDGGNGVNKSQPTQPPKNNKHVNQYLNKDKKTNNQYQKSKESFQKAQGKLQQGMMYFNQKSHIQAKEIDE